MASAPVLAQMPPGMDGTGRNRTKPLAQPPPPEEKYVPKDTGPLPEPLDAASEAARERAKEAGVLRAATPHPGKVFEIRIEGSRKIEPDAVLVQVQSRVDRAPDRRVIRADVRRIYRMKLFSDVVVKVHTLDNGSLALIYQLVEKPAITGVLLEGNDDVSEDDIREVIDLKTFQVLDVPRVRATVAKIQSLYVDKGFYLADVTWEIRPSDGTPKDQESDRPFFFAKGAEWFDFEKGKDDKAGENGDQEAGQGVDGGRWVDVVFKIIEHAKVKVERINIVGNEAITDDELKAIIRTRENHPLGILTEWGTYKEELAEMDLLAIEAMYQDRGYINVQVGRPQIELSQDKTRMSITIPVTEGKKYTLRSFDIAGDLITDDADEYRRIRKEDKDRIIFLKDNLLGETTIKAGDVFSRSAVGHDILAITDRYRDKGHAYVNVVPQTKVHDEDNSVELTLEAQAGPRVTVERIEIVGNTKTQDRVIRRELRLYEGDYFSASELRRSEQRVKALGFFETVDITTKEGSQPDRMQVVIKIAEKATGTFQLGAGFSNAEQFILTGQIAQNNFLGRGHTISGSIQWSKFRNIIDFRFIDPYAFYVAQEPITLAFSVFNTQRNFIDFFRNSLGSDITLGYPVGRPFSSLTTPIIAEAPKALRPYVPDLENLQLFFTVNNERVEIAEQSFNVRLLGLAANVPRYTTSLKGSLLFDQRNDRLFPSQGYFLQLQAEFASPFFGSALAPSLETNADQLSQKISDRVSIFQSGGQANDFTRFTFTGRAYYSFDDLLPFKGVVAKVNLEMGYLRTKDRSLVFEQYFLGGFNTIRGYFPRSIGPVERVGGINPDEPLQEFRVGGNKQIYTNLELEFPIFQQVGIRGVLFLDAGNAYGADENLFYIGNGPTQFLKGARCGQEKCFDPRTDLPLGLFTSVGFGVRWFSPIGPLRFEWGVPLRPRPLGTFGFAQGDKPIQFEFNIGNSF